MILFFYTQPPEGGCEVVFAPASTGKSFNTQPPEGGCRTSFAPQHDANVSTHSRPKAAAIQQRDHDRVFRVSTHSRPKAAAQWFRAKRFRRTVSTHSRPKAAAHCVHPFCIEVMFQHTAARRRLRERNASPATGRSFNTQPPEGGCRYSCSFVAPALTFQHTAARRRLPKINDHEFEAAPVSTHSRPKAAA